MKQFLCLAVLALVPFTAFALAQEKKTTPAAMTDDPAMANMMAYATPGAAHQKLAPRVGKWNLAVKMFQPDGQPADESTATSEARWIFDGRYVEEAVQGEFAGMPFHGRGLSGYDNFKKKYVSTWIDSMSTGIMVSEGAWDDAGKTFSYSGEMPDFATGKLVRGRTTYTATDADHWTMKMFQPGPGGAEYLSMQIDYTRAK
jgi:hypothetical protein